MSDYGQTNYDEDEAPDFARIANPAERAAAAEQYAAQLRMDADRAALQGNGQGLDLGGEPPARHPGVEGLEAFDTRIHNRGGSREAASCEVTNRLVHAAIRGDKRVLVDSDWAKNAMERGDF